MSDFTLSSAGQETQPVTVIPKFYAKCRHSPARLNRCDLICFSLVNSVTMKLSQLARLSHLRLTKLNDPSG
jgi:hypothetical protein